MTSSTPFPLNRLCPAARIVLLIITFGWMLTFTHPLTALIPFLIALAGVALARGGALLRRLAPLLLLLMGMTIVIWTLLTPAGAVLCRLGELTISVEGLSHATAMALRLSGMMIAGMAFIAATPVEELRVGLSQLGLPYPMAFAIGLAFRLVPVFSTMLQTTIQAQQIRGHLLDSGGTWHRMRNYAPLIIPVILLSLRNTDRLAVALAARGYGRVGARTSILDHRWQWSDTLVIVVAAVIGGLSVWQGRM